MNIGTNYQRLVVNPVPFDAKRTNCYVVGSNIVIETVAEFLVRIPHDIRDTYPILILTPKDGYNVGAFPIEDFDSTLATLNLDIYAFIGGFQDENLTFLYRTNLTSIDFGSNTIISLSQNLPVNAGIVITPAATKNGDGTVTLGTDGVFNFAINASGTLGIIQRPITTGQTIALTDGAVNFIYADYNSGTPNYQVTLDNLSLKDDFTKIPVIRATREGTTIHFEEYDEYGLLLANKMMAKDIFINGATRLDGLVLSTAATRISTVSLGKAVFGVQYYMNMAANIAGSAGSLYEYYLTSSSWHKSLVTSYDSTYYSDGTNRQTLNNNYWVAKYFWRDVGDDNEVYFIHGNQYNQKIDAYNELIPTAPSVMTAHSVYVGKIVIQKGSNNGTAYPRQWEGAVQSSGGSSHSDLTNLNWTNSGHTGTPNKLAGFGTSGEAVYLDKQTVIQFTYFI